MFALSFAFHALAFAQKVEEPDTCAHLGEVVVTGVTGNARARETAAPVTVLSDAALRSHQSLGIVDALSHQPGINQISTGGVISKPVIRGMGYNRVLVVADGIRQEGQQWGDEHGVEIDGRAVHSVEILKGPASLMYGSDALAGVIVMRDAPVMPMGSMYAEAGTEYQTNNGLAAYTLNFRGNQQGLVWNWRWSQKWAHDYQAPLDGYVAGTRFRERALNGMLGVNRSWGSSHLKLSHYHLTPGLAEADAWGEGSGSYRVGCPYQEVRHEKVVSDNYIHLPQGYLKAIVGYQQNRRQEYEEAHECGLDFRLHSLNYDLRYVSPEWAGWKLSVGLGGMYQQSQNLGEEYLIPAYHLSDLGTFATASRSFAGRLHVSGGLRYDHRWLHSHGLEEDGELRFRDFHRRFGALSGSMGAIYNITRRLDVKLNVAHGFRAPNLSELGSNGVHEGTFRYELGNMQLKPEHSWQADLGLDYAATHFSASLALFAARVSDYIFLQRAAYDMEEVPAYVFTAGDARLLGGEARVILHLFHHLHFENNFSMVDARLLHAPSAGRYLPFTPAPRWLSILHYDIPLRWRVLKGAFVELEVDNNFRQDHVMTEGATETPTPAYTLLNLSLGTDVHLPSGRKLCTLGLTATNLFDKAYQSHLSRLKYADTFPLSGRHGFCNMGRNVGISLLFPLETGN